MGIHKPITVLPGCVLGSHDADSSKTAAIRASLDNELPGVDLICRLPFEIYLVVLRHACELKQR